MQGSRLVTQAQLNLGQAVIAIEEEVARCVQLQAELNAIGKSFERLLGTSPPLAQPAEAH